VTKEGENVRVTAWLSMRMSKNVTATGVAKAPRKGRRMKYNFVRFIDGDGYLCMHVSCIYAPG